MVEVMVDVCVFLRITEKRLPEMMWEGPPPWLCWPIVFFYPVLMLASSHFHSAGGRSVLLVEDVMCSDGEGFSTCRKKRLPGVMWGGAPPWLSRFHTRCHLTSPWWQWRKIIVVVCNVVTAQERNSFLSICILYPLFYVKSSRIMRYHYKNMFLGIIFAISELLLQFHVMDIHTFNQTNQTLCPATYLLTLNFNPCVVHDICPASQDVSNACFLQATSTSPCYISLFSWW